MNKGFKSIRHHWVEVMPLFSTNTNGVVKILLDNKIPWFGLIENIDSDNGRHFTANVIRELVRLLDIIIHGIHPHWEKLKE
jgi:hypothetical protein